MFSSLSLIKGRLAVNLSTPRAQGTMRTTRIWPLAAFEVAA
jgi:hypothetical protein